MKNRINFSKGTTKRTRYFLIGLILITLMIIVAFSGIRTDNYFMLANWREFLVNGFYVKDPLSMHHEYRCSIEKWLSCAMFYYLYQAGGIVLLRIVLTILCIVISILLYQLCFYTSNNEILSLLFTELILFMGGSFIEFRPQVVTVILLLIEAIILEHVVKENRPKLLFFLPIISWLEMQFHSTIWPSFFMVLFPYILDFRVENHKVIIDKKRTLILCMTTLICSATLFLNPYGAWSVFYIFRSYGDPYMKAIIGELSNTTFFYNGVWEIWFILIILAFMIGDKKIPIRYYLLCFGFYCFAWTAIRNQIFFDFIGSFVLCYMLRDIKISFRWNLIPVIPVTAVILLTFYVSDYAKMNNYQEDRGRAYVEAFDWLASHYGVNGEEIYCDVDAGSYAEYLGYHPYIDARAEVYLKKVNGVEDSWHEYTRLRYGSIYYKDFLAGKNFAYLLVNPQVTPSFYQELLQDDSYKVIFNEENEVIFMPVVNFP